MIRRFPSTSVPRWAGWLALAAAIAPVAALALAAGRAIDDETSSPLSATPRPSPIPQEATEMETSISSDRDLRLFSSLGRLRPRGWVAGVLSWLGIALLGVAVLALVFVALAPRLFGIHMVIVEGKSMEPHIHYGALAIMQDTTAKDVKVGDIVEFTAPQTHWVTTHRIVGISTDHKSFTTKGDANNTPDQAPLPASDIHAKYLFSIPEVGNAVRWLHSRDGYLAIVLIPGIAIILLELASIANELRKPREGQDQRSDPDGAHPVAGA